MDFRPTVVSGGVECRRVAVPSPVLLDAPGPVGRDARAPSARRTKGSTPVAVIKVSRLWPTSRPAPAAAAPFAYAAESREGLDAFGSEDAPAVVVPPPVVPAMPDAAPVVAARTIPVSRLWTAMLAVVLFVGLGAAGAWQYRLRAAAAGAVGSLTLTTMPAGADVVIAGTMAGRTPLTTALAPGSYDVQVTSAGQRRDLKVTIAAGASNFHQLEFPAAAPATPAPASTGALRVQADFSQAMVTVDGVERGRSPLIVEGLEPGAHDVVVRGERGTFRRSVQIKPQETLALMIAAGEPTAVLPGWLALSSPIVLQLREGGRVIGTTESDRLMVPAGEHEIELVNEALGFQSTLKVTVGAGKTASANVQLPTGLLSINALPWAEVWVDGERIGETPIANLSRRIGSHEVVFRHPQLGERTETIVVTAKQPARLGIDLRRRQP
jgi:hypothetical protein